MPNVVRRLFRLAGREPDLDTQVAEEIASHLAMKVDALVRQGVPRAEAEREAHRQFGTVTAVARETRAAAADTERRRAWSDRRQSGLATIRVSLRGLLRSPGYASATVGILALGIGATLAVLALADRVLLRPLPYTDPDQLLVMVETRADGALQTPSFPTVKDWQADGKSLSAIAYVTGGQVRWRGLAGIEGLVAAYPPGNFFDLMGARPELGRTITIADEQDARRVAVLTYRLWRQRFGQDQNIIGTSLPLADGPVAIIGVLPAGFDVPGWADLYLPMSLLPAQQRSIIASRGNHADALTIGRLAPGASIGTARAEMRVIAGRLATAYPAEQGSWTDVSLLSLSDYALQFGTQGLTNPRTAVLVFLAAVSLVLLIACANVAGLALVRTHARRRELAVRAALGATRWQLMRHLLLESSLLTAAGGALGMLFAKTLIWLLQRGAPDLVPRILEVRFDGVIPAAAVGIIGLAAALSGLYPALRLTRSNQVAGVNDGPRGAAGQAATSVHQSLVAGQVALAVTLFIGTGVLVKSFLRVVSTDLGFAPKGLLAVTIYPSREFRDKREAIATFQRLEEAVVRVPGVRSVGFTNHLPASGGSYPTRLEVEGYTPATQEATPSANYRVVSAGYFATMGIPLVRGRAFAPADFAAPNDGLVVNQALADAYWPGQDPVGKRLTVFKSARWLPDFGEPISGRVIGVVGDVRHFGVETTPPAEVFLPHTWNPWSWIGMAVRTEGDPRNLIDAVWKAVTSVDPGLPIASGASRNIVAFDDLLATSRQPRRVLTTVAIGLAAAALTLAVAGVYGVVAYLVRLRRRELAIRGALGATRGQLRLLMMRRSLVMVGLGALVGVAAGWAGVVLLQGLLFGVATHDVTAFSLAPLLLLAASAAAILVAIRRNHAPDPARVLSEE